MAGLCPAVAFWRGDPVFRKILAAVILVPLAAVIVAFAVANRQTVIVSFDPFSSTAPAYAASLPLFVLIFIVLILGVIVGGIAAWLRQTPWRRTARKLDADVRELHEELAAFRRHYNAVKPPEPAETASPPVLPPPIS
jgi:uncharacterized integral membrane protein